MASIVSLLVSAFLILFPLTLDNRDDVEPLPVPEYSCGEPIWVEGPMMVQNNKYFKGKVEVECTFSECGLCSIKECFNKSA